MPASAKWDCSRTGTRTETARLPRKSLLEACSFGRFDDDGDGSLTTAEWDAGIDAWYGENQLDLEYSNWDGDGTLSEEEFTSGFEAAGLFENFTTSARLENVEDDVGEEEFFGGLFDWFDADDDGGLIADEACWFG